MNNPFALIVEDNKDLADIFATALQTAGFETQIAEAGDIALTQLTSITPDLVVLDLNLPRVPGREVLHHIRANPRLENVQVIIATAYPRMAENLQKEADLILLKPVSFIQLRDLAMRFSPGAV
jgi:CheY-like chemotaxis protein